MGNCKQNRPLSILLFNLYLELINAYVVLIEIRKYFNTQSFLLWQSFMESKQMAVICVCVSNIIALPILTHLIRHDLLQNNNCVSNWQTANFRLFNW